MKPALALAALQEEAVRFSDAESGHAEAMLYGVTDGKAIGTYFEHKFKQRLAANSGSEPPGRRDRGQPDGRTAVEVSARAGLPDDLQRFAVAASIRQSDRAGRIDARNPTAALMTAMTPGRRRQIEFGDFQTPAALAAAVCDLLVRRSLRPTSLLEPTCGQGAFLDVALRSFPTLARVIAIDVNPTHVSEARARVRDLAAATSALVVEGDCFTLDWSRVLTGLADPVLVIGNPPWVTTAGLSALGSTNVPEKTNSRKHTGIDAITGKSNFDVSEWLLLRLLRCLEGRRATLAMLCKTAVARKVLAEAWRNGPSLAGAEIRVVDALAHFGAAVDACLLVCEIAPGARTRECSVFDSIAATSPVRVIGLRDNELVADLWLHAKWARLRGHPSYKWRSGVKHDCARVMELRLVGDALRNGLEERVDVEEEYLYPLLKSSDIANGAVDQPTRRLIVTQRSMGDNTTALETGAPRLWRYLQRHAVLLDARSSSIYKGRPRFCVFGVGDYTFAPWKVAISGFYKRFSFKVVGPSEGKPVVFDDTVYFVACLSEEEARMLAALLNSSPAREFFSSYVFWDSKRPITVDLLCRLDLLALARELGLEAEVVRHVRRRAAIPRSVAAQASLFQA